jgi:putative methyltransferase (TIGR04325 family)
MALKKLGPIISKPQIRHLISDLIPPIALRPAQKLWRCARGVGWHNFEGAWPTLGEVPVTPMPTGDDPWARTLVEGWRESLKDTAKPIPVVDNTGMLILPVFASQFSGPLTVLDFGGGPATGLVNILRYTRGLDLSRFFYVLVETPAMCRAIRSEIDVRSGEALEEIPDKLSLPLIVHAGSSLQYVPDYQRTLDRLTGLAPKFFIVSQTPMTDRPTYARQILTMPHVKAATWVFNRSEFIAGMKRRGYLLIFTVDHDLPLTHKNAPGPSVMASMVFVPAQSRSNQPTD